MEEALRCRAIGAVIGELRHGEIDAVAVRRLSLAAADSGALGAAAAQCARGRTHPPPRRAGWLALHPSPGGGGEKEKFEFGAPRFAAHLIRNRRGPTGSWILEWSDTDERFVSPRLLCLWLRRLATDRIARKSLEKSREVSVPLVVYGKRGNTELLVAIDGRSGTARPAHRPHAGAGARHASRARSCA
ncbi:MAG: hypothetical protein WDN48_08315 [Pseudolabrys sp.]